MNILRKEGVRKLFDLSLVTDRSILMLDAYC